MPDTIVSMMIREKGNWDACANFVEKVLREKKADEHLVDQGCEYLIPCGNKFLNKSGNTSDF